MKLKIEDFHILNNEILSSYEKEDLEKIESFDDLITNEEIRNFYDTDDWNDEINYWISYYRIFWNFFKKTNHVELTNIENELLNELLINKKEGFNERK